MSVEDGSLLIVTEQGGFVPTSQHCAPGIHRGTHYILIPIHPSVMKRHEMFHLGQMTFLFKINTPVSYRQTV